MAIPKLLVATTNAGKLKEFKEILGDSLFQVIGPREIEIEPTDIIETGKSYTSNAIAKATAMSRLTGLATIADDSGLEVDALNGAPGPVSARYGMNLYNKNVKNDEDRNMLVLERLRDIPISGRSARFRACIALVLPGNLPITREGLCEGRIALEPQGESGFGYDPIFLIRDGRSFAELGSYKNEISHRAKALFAIRSVLQKFN
jgi:XTP/dITP diphosphohydrolase